MLDRKGDHEKKIVAHGNVMHQELAQKQVYACPFASPIIQRTYLECVLFGISAERSGPPCSVVFPSRATGDGAELELTPMSTRKRSMVMRSARS